MEEILVILDKLSRKVDKLSNTVNKIAKTLHLLPVTEKEEREIQILQRTNLQQAAKVNEELNAIQNNSKEPATLFSIYDKAQYVYGDVVADDFLGGFVNE